MGLSLRPSLESTDEARAASAAERLEAQGDTAARDGRWEEAVACYRRSAQLSPFNRRVKVALANAIVKSETEPKAARRNASPAGSSSDRVARMAVAAGGAAVDVAGQMASGVYAAMQAAGRKVADGQQRRTKKPGAAPQHREPLSVSKHPRGEARPRFQPRSLAISVALTGVVLVVVGIVHGVVADLLTSKPLPKVVEVQRDPALLAALEGAQARLLAGDAEEAVGMLREGRERWPQEASAVETALAQALRAQASKLLEQRKHAEAAAAFREAAELEPERAGTWMDLGRAHREAGRAAQGSGGKDAKVQFAHALESYQKALSLQAGDPAALLGLAQTYVFQGNRAEAVKAYERIVAEAPNTPEAAQAKVNLKQLVGG